MATDPISPTSDTKAAGAALLLRSASALMGVVSLGLVTWVIDKAYLRPWERVANDLGFWIPFTVTVVVGGAGLIVVFLRAARRVQAGEDLFARRHRRRPGT
ncbi:MAG: hypothetical protein AAGI71_01630 [Bacteroidota bacterium]